MSSGLTDWLIEPVGWIPAWLVLPIIIVKGSLSLLNLTALVVHMWRRGVFLVQRRKMRPAQRLRYNALLIATVTFMEASLEQGLTPNYDFHYRNLLGLLSTIVIAFAVRASIVEAETQPREE